MAPSVGRGVTGTDLINAPSPLPNTVATLVAQVFHNVMDAHSKPAPFIPGLLLHCDSK